VCVAGLEAGGVSVPLRFASVNALKFKGSMGTLDWRGTIPSRRESANGLFSRGMIRTKARISP